MSNRASSGGSEGEEEEEIGVEDEEIHAFRRRMKIHVYGEKPAKPIGTFDDIVAGKG